MKPKFRAWFILDKKMVEHENLSMQYDRDEGFTFAFDYMSYFDEENMKGTLNFELMQYTGLKDKNGKEIYEGDVMVYRTYVFNDTGRKGIVCFDINQSRYKLVPYVAYKENAGNGGWSGHTFDLHICEESEVIGNIYENPELLESEGK